MLRAISHADEVGTGDTRPQVFWCLDEQGKRSRWVLKLMGLANVELASDWIGTIFAQRLGIPSPRPDIALVDEAALQTAPPQVKEWAKPGLAFASEENPRTVALHSDADVLRFATDQDIGMMFALDVWLDVLDRRRPDGSWNLLVSTETRSVIVIDYGKGLTSALLPLLGNVAHWDLGYPYAVRLHGSVQVALQTAETVQAIGADDIMEVVASVPPDWLPNDRRQGVIQLLSERALLLPLICVQLHSRQIELSK